MTTIERTILPYETDINGFTPPSILLHLAMEANMRETTAENSDREKLIQELGATWMIARTKLEQFRPIRSGETLTFDLSESVVECSTFFRTVKIISEGNIAAICQFAFILVLFKERHIVRPKDVGYVQSCTCENPSELSFKRLRLTGNLDNIGSFTVRYSDCDINGHLAGANYADIICEHIGYWKSSPRSIESLQIDYSAECLPDEEVDLYSCTESDTVYVKGIKKDGTIAFNSCCKLKDL